MAAPNKEIVYKYNIDDEHIEISQLHIHMIDHASKEEPAIKISFDVVETGSKEVKSELWFIIFLHST